MTEWRLRTATRADTIARRGYLTSETGAPAIEIVSSTHPPRDG
jgi:hypothetical protein